MKREIQGMLVEKALEFVSGEVGKIIQNPADYFTPHWEKITVFAFLGKAGEWRVSKGEVSTSLALEVATICRDAGVADGWIAYKSEPGHNRVECSPSIPPQAQQRIRNAIFST